MTDFAHSAAARQARLVKADKLAELLITSPGPWPKTDRDRRIAERAAGVRPCSDETWALARSLHADLAARRPVS
jgi:hypothetical protein